MKTVTTLLVAASAMMALAIPSAASAQWQHNHGAMEENPQVQFTGQFKAEGAFGILACQVDVRFTLLANTTTAAVEGFEVDQTESGTTVTDKCSVDITLETLDCDDIGGLTTEGLPWVAHGVTAQTLAVTTGAIQYHLDGSIFCPKTIQLTPGTFHLGANSAKTWSTGVLSGQQKIHAPGGTQNATINGHWSMTPSATYGIG